MHMYLSACSSQLLNAGGKEPYCSGTQIRSSNRLGIWYFMFNKHAHESLYTSYGLDQLHIRFFYYYLNGNYKKK